MKPLLLVLIVSSFAVTSWADIQDPPAADYGPTRKLGRGLTNMAFGWAEIGRASCRERVCELV